MPRNARKNKKRALREKAHKNLEIIKTRVIKVQQMGSIQQGLVHGTNEGNDLKMKDLEPFSSRLIYAF